MELELKNLKGTCDFLPQQQMLRNKITSILKSNSRTDSNLFPDKPLTFKKIFNIEKKPKEKRGRSAKAAP